MKWIGANAGPEPGDMPIDRYIASLPLPRYGDSRYVCDWLRINWFEVSQCTPDELKLRIKMLNDGT